MTATPSSFIPINSAGGAGRYAPSPTGDLHLGNLRTAVIAWSLAHLSGRDFKLRVENLDRVRAGSADGQLADLAALGLAWDQPVVYQDSRIAVYEDAIEQLSQQGLVYECYCSRKDIREATSAPHILPGTYPGTCRNLTDEERATRRVVLSEQGRSPSLRLRSEVSEFTVQDQFAGAFTGPVDDVVIRRGDGVIAYNLAVVIDDAFQGIDQVCRGDDLLSSSPRQAYLASLLGLPPVTYAHVPLVLNPAGERLAKRDGAVSMRDLAGLGWGADQVLAWIASSLGVEGAEGATGLTLPEVARQISWETVNNGPVIFDPPQLAHA
ncbi:tRNA glutamyl-Q(34) synthetase GluQRS [Boudabousia marimammalium]|uniref:tRNA glutamyl-Q(34) synthetase GluQRS n=1 Tax=Boudabousia marimammalium TaxID=156892 RepID=A0A1Q5PNZ5_9ACTO|nr:tRNA glutamyl-Q(34) synthetase GluQRS [Boudabousia marimammalium]OKL49283.1 tRNA glutamyl-Q(34) synthetase GluQRS [Boudabousia marimammalium]